MHRPNKLVSGTALLAASLAFTAVPQAVASASLPTVSVRIEGKAKTLLPARMVTVKSGSITRGGAPAGACPATSAQGALNVASKGRWTGSFSKQYQEYFITKILGDSESGKKSFFEIFVNHVAATAGACQIKLHSGDQLVFAAVPATGTAYPIGLTAPSVATVGHTFQAKVVYYNAKGKAKPLAGATVTAGSGSGPTSSSGVVQLTPTHAGTFTLTASKAGYVRDEVTVTVK